MSSPEFNQLLVNSADSLRPFAIRLTKDADRARDLLQETLCKALVNREKYHVGTNIKAWLCTIMRNIFINDYRRKAVQKTIFDVTAGDQVAPRYAVINPVEGRLQVKEIDRALHQLPVIFRTPFLLYFEGYKYHEVAFLLKEPLGTIKSRIHFARKQLKQQVAR